LTSRRQLIGQLRRPISAAAADPADNTQKNSQRFGLTRGNAGFSTAAVKK
jgi:hypothetical protein